MKFLKEYFFCSPRMLSYIDEIHEIEDCIKAVQWQTEFTVENEGKIYSNQAGYNKALDDQFSQYDWNLQPILYKEHPRLIGDYSKNDIFVEVQFGNTSTIFRDYYKFHYGLTHSLLSLAVLVVPTNPVAFFPTRPDSIRNMAEFDFAKRYFKLLPIPVPILLIGLLPEND